MKKKKYIDKLLSNPTQDNLDKALTYREKLIKNSKGDKYVDLLRDLIFEKVWRNFKAYEVDFIMEMFTKFGGAFNLVYDDNGHWAIGESLLAPTTTTKFHCDLDLVTTIEAGAWKRTIRKALKYWIENSYLV